jgi:long-chain fatty acid transport protein
MRKSNLALAVAAGALCAISPVRAAGFSIFEQGAKASAQAGAFAARADDPSALFYNPAGITQLEGWNVYGNINGIAISTTFHSLQAGHRKDKFDMDDSLLPAGGVFLTWTPHGWDRVSFGVGAYTPFGLTTKWGPDFEGRYIARDSELKTAFVSPTAAFRLDSEGHWSIAAQANWAFADVTLSKNIDFSALGAKDGLVKLTDKADGWGGSIGLHYGNDEGWNFGATWHSQIVLNFDDAEARFEHTPALADLLLCGGSPCFPDQSASSKLTLPESFVAAFGKTGDRVDWEVDWVHTGWDKFETLDFDFEQNTPALADSQTPEDWENANSIRVGLGFHVNDAYELRFGVYHDESPVPSRTLRPTVPDSDRNSVQIGVGYTNPADTFSFDFYYQAIKFDEVKTTDQIDGLNGSYKTSGHLFGVGGHWRF